MCLQQSMLNTKKNVTEWLSPCVELYHDHKQYLLRARSASVITKLSLSIFFSDILNCIIYRFSKEIWNDYDSRSTFYFFGFSVSNFKYNLVFFNFQLVTGKWNNKSLTIELVTGNEINNLLIRVSNSKCNFLFFNLELVTWNWNKKSLIFDLVTRSEIFLLFYFELVTQSVTFYFSTSS